MIELRAARATDVEVIAKIFQTSFIDTFGSLYPPSDLAQFLSEKSSAVFGAEIENPAYVFQLAVVGGEEAGFIKLGPPQLPVETPPRSIEICQLYVQKDWHGTGVAQALMAWALDEARKQGVEHIQLSVYIENQRARRFYEMYGFTQVGRYDFMVGNHVDEDIILRHIVLQADP